ncbi:hypothetical protein NC653_003401 [Populus alba x Populus x berolinensis]|uniref:BAR domain-containing protein n=1 Tax=Populus alba x Populus x berolinensis TaxID=444605 RepID=A0AAD6WI75_9ROSI|nr:hypothetical protein NC653_003401 [Populus alba x Populus x berolinensis]
MKSKLRGFRLRRSEPKDKIDFLPPAQLDELAQAAQDMKDMKNCYDSLLSAAAATANSAYEFSKLTPSALSEFSESLREMGSCLLEKTALHDDEGSGRVLLMLGKVQFELKKLLDSYRSHIFLTITNPSESLLNELRTVEDMKRQCDEKRNVYEYMVAQQKDKGRSKGGKDESITLQQLQTAREEYDEEATLCVFRLKSLKQGQSRSLLTQAARHHAAQLNFFQKGLKSLETVEPHVRLVTEHQHIDYHFSGLESDAREDGEDDGEDGDDTNEGRELSFDYRENNEGNAVVSAARGSMEDMCSVSSLFMACSCHQNDIICGLVFTLNFQSKCSECNQIYKWMRKPSLHNPFTLPCNKPSTFCYLEWDLSILGINILFFLWVRMGLLWFLGNWGQGQQRVVLIMFMVVGQQRKKFLLDLNLANFKRYSSDDGKHVLYEREFMFKTVDEEDLSFQVSAAENVELNPDKNHGGFHFPSREPRGGSHSAPIVPERKPDPVERIRQMQQASRKSNTYVLPTPIDAKGAISSRTSCSVPNTRQTDISGRTHNLWHSSPLEQKKNEKDSGDGHLSDFTALKARSGHKESNNPNASTQLPPPLVGGISYPQLDVHNASDYKKNKWQSFSGPITSKPWSMKPLSSSGPISSTELSQQVSGMLSRVQPSSSPKVSPSTSPPLVSSPKISELHELPRPPGNLAAKAAKPSVPIGHSAPLSRNPELAGTSKISTGAANLASPLPPPPLIVPRSFSIPSSSQRAMTVHVSKLLDSSQVSYKPGEVDSPPLTPISLANMRPAPAISEPVPHSGQIRGHFLQGKIDKEGSTDELLGQVGADNLLCTLAEKLRFFGVLLTIFWISSSTSSGYCKYNNFMHCLVSHPNFCSSCDL